MSITALRQPEKPVRDLRAEIAQLQAREHKLTQTEIARQSGVSLGRLNPWLKGVYMGDFEKIEAELARWIDAHNIRAIETRALAAAPKWVRTPSGDRVLAAFGYAQLAADISVIYGGAGIGKTSAINEYQRTNPNVWVATMTPATATVVPALEEVALALGLREVSGGAARIQRAIISYMRGTHGLLVIDEAQHLGTGALDAVRSLHDAAQIGLALVGNESVYARMTGGNRAAYLDRLFSRIGKRVRLTRAHGEDIDALIDAWGVRAKDCRKALHEIAARPGGLRGLTKTMRLASTFAASSKHEVSCDDIRAAWRDLGGDV